MASSIGMGSIRAGAYANIPAQLKRIPVPCSSYLALTTDSRSDVHFNAEYVIK